MNPDDFDPGPLADVQRVDDGSRAALLFVRDLTHPPERVWAALTRPEQLRQWAPYAPDRDLARVGPATLTMIDGMSDAELATDVQRAEPPSVLEYRWGDDLLTWELSPRGTGTRLTLRQTVSAPDWMPKLAAGWHICLVVAEHFMAGRPIGPITGARAMDYGWQALHDAYARNLEAGNA